MRSLTFFMLLSSSICAQAQDQPPSIQATAPRRGSIIRYVTLPGTILPNQQATLFAKVGGYLGKVAVDKGGKVERGQILAEIEVPELEADLKKHQAEAQLAEVEWQRLREARKKSPDLITPQALDKAEAALAISKAEIQHTEALLRYAKITAPFDGIVTMRYFDPGAFVPAAAAGSTPQSAALFTLMDFTTVRAQASVPEKDAALVRQGQPVRFTVDGLPEKTFTGAVSRFSYALDDTTRNMIVQADIPNPDLQLRPGMYARIGIGVEKHSNVLLLPKAAVITEKAAHSVFKLVDGKAKKTPVQIGFDDGTNVEILEGAANGDTILLPGKLPLTDGQAVPSLAIQ